MPVSTTFKDYYGILGITTRKAATTEEIKAAYKQLALQWHPDRHATGKEKAGRKFIEINEAYKFLMDSGRREWYDNFPATGDKTRRRSTAFEPENLKPSTAGGVEVPADETRPFNKAKSDFGATNAAKPADTVPDSGMPSAGVGGVEVPADETPSMKKAKSDFSMPNAKPADMPPDLESPAPAKRAKSEPGLRNQEPVSSSRSDSKSHKQPSGEKNIEADLRDFLRRLSNADKQASDKEQSFKTHTVYDDSDSDTPSIRIGSGMQLHTTTVVTTGIPSEWVFPLPLTLEDLSSGADHRYQITRHLTSGKKKKIVVDINIAPGWKKGTKIRFPGAGNERPGKPPQDVVFIVEEVPHEHFIRKGSSLVTRVNISLLEALTGEGRSVYVKGLDGQDIEVDIPPGVIKPGDECRVVGAGMPIRKHGAVVGKGDMMIRWEIVFPQHLSKKQIKVLRKAFAD